MYNKCDHVIYHVYRTCNIWYMVNYIQIYNKCDHVIYYVYVTFNIWYMVNTT